MSWFGFFFFKIIIVFNCIPSKLVLEHWHKEYRIFVVVVWKEELNSQKEAYLVMPNLHYVVWVTETFKLCKFKLNSCEWDSALQSIWIAYWILERRRGGKSKHSFKWEFLFTALVIYCEGDGFHFQCNGKPNSVRVPHFLPKYQQKLT